MRQITMIAMLFVLITGQAYTQTKQRNKTKQMEQIQKTDVFPKGEIMTTYFSGKAWVYFLSNDVAQFDAMVYNVTFEPGSRNYWHSHPGGQILLCTSGEGYYQEKGLPIRLLKAGDVVEVKPNIEHWHGATPHQQFVHVGITPKASKNETAWYRPVSDDEYNSFGK